MVEKMKDGVEFIKKLQDILKLQNVSFDTHSFLVKRFAIIACELGNFGCRNEEINDELCTSMDVLKAATLLYCRVLLELADGKSDENYKYSEYSESSENSENTYYSEDGW